MQLDSSNRFDTIPTLDRQKDVQTHDDSKCCASTASLGKKTNTECSKFEAQASRWNAKWSTCISDASFNDFSVSFTIVNLYLVPCKTTFFPSHFGAYAPVNMYSSNCWTVYPASTRVVTLTNNAVRTIYQVGVSCITGINCVFFSNSESFNNQTHRLVVFTSSFSYKQLSLPSPLSSRAIAARQLLIVPIKSSSFVRVQHYWRHYTRLSGNSRVARHSLKSLNPIWSQNCF